MSAAKDQMEEIVAQQDRVKTQLGYLTRIQLVKQASGIINEIQINLQTLHDKKRKEQQKSGASAGLKQQVPRATSAEDLFNLVIPAPSFEPTEINQHSPPMQDI